MRVHHMMALFLCCVVCLLGAAAQESVQNEQKKLQGVWQVSKFIDESEEPDTKEEIEGFTFEFRGDQLTMRKGKAGGGHKMKYTLDPSKQPKWIDLDMGMEVAEGIYKLEKDELSICLLAEARRGGLSRPAQFKDSKRDKHALFVLTRIKK